MVNYLKSEFLKQRRRFNIKLLWLSPLIPIALAIILMHGCYFMEGTFNWWYTLILPGTLTMLISFSITAEKQHNRHGLFTVCVDKKNLWISQILINTIMLLFINLVFFAFLIVSGKLLGIRILLFKSLIASVVLFLTFAWQIPVLMFVSEKLGSFVTIIISLVCNMGFGIFLAPSKLWYIPFAIPSRLMCPIIKVMPNGLPIEQGNPLDNSSVIFIGITVTVTLYFLSSLLTILWFDRKEVK